MAIATVRPVALAVVFAAVIGTVSPSLALVTPNLPGDLHQHRSGAGEDQARPGPNAQYSLPVPPSDGQPQEAPDQPHRRDQKNAGWLMTALGWLWGLRPNDGWQALFNALLVAVGFLQWRVYRDQAKIMEETREIAFASLGRPHVFFEFVSHNFADWREGRSNFRTRFRFVNYGTGPAIVRDVLGRCFLSYGPWQQDQDDFDGIIKPFPEKHRLIWQGYVPLAEGRPGGGEQQRDIADFVLRPGKRSPTFELRLP